MVIVCNLHAVENRAFASWQSYKICLLYSLYLYVAGLLPESGRESNAHSLLPRVVGWGVEAPRTSTEQIASLNRSLITKKTIYGRNRLCTSFFFGNMGKISYTAPTFWLPFILEN
jgi:hypothetical protein